MSWSLVILTVDVYCQKPWQGIKKAESLTLFIWMHLCVQNINPLFDKFSAQAKADKRFNHGEIDGPHDVMVTDPARMRDALIAIL